MHTWADQFRTYEDACIYYGADTPAQLAAEEEYFRQEEAVVTQDELEAWGGALARSHALGVEHAQWCAASQLPEPTDREWIRTVLWGRTPARGLPAAPAPKPGPLGPDDEIPF